MDPVKVGRAIQVLRRKIGFTQHDLADEMGVTDKAVSKWERGLSVPDIAGITRLSFLLNCDIENLLEGNIACLEEPWQGLLILDPDDSGLYAGMDVYGKPLVYFSLSYLMLAGIKDIHILCSEWDRRFIAEKLKEEGDLGIHVAFLSSLKDLPEGNTVVIRNYDFIYGSNLTRYFQRAITKTDRISCLTISKPAGSQSVDFDNSRLIHLSRKKQWHCTSVLFFPESKYSRISSGFLELVEQNELYAEPMGNGVIEYPIENKDDILATAEFIRYLRKQMGNDIYDLKQIARNRNLIR